MCKFIHTYKKKNPQIHVYRETTVFTPGERRLLLTEWGPHEDSEKVVPPSLNKQLFTWDTNSWFSIQKHRLMHPGTPETKKDTSRRVTGAISHASQYAFPGPAKCATKRDLKELQWLHKENDSTEWTSSIPQRANHSLGGPVRAHLTGIPGGICGAGPLGIL